MQIGRLPAGLLIIEKYLQCSLAVMGQFYLPSDKALLLLWQGTKAITSCRANNLLVPPCVCFVRVATDLSSPAKYHLLFHMLKTDISLSGSGKSNFMDFFNATGPVVYLLCREYFLWTPLNLKVNSCAWKHKLLKQSHLKAYLGAVLELWIKPNAQLLL